MERVFYYLMAGVFVATLAIPILFGGGWLWVLPVVSAVIIVAYLVWDRRARREESPGEHLAAD